MPIKALDDIRTRIENALLTDADDESEQGGDLLPSRPLRQIRDRLENALLEVDEDHLPEPRGSAESADRVIDTTGSAQGRGHAPESAHGSANGSANRTATPVRDRPAPHPGPDTAARTGSTNGSAPAGPDTAARRDTGVGSGADTPTDTPADGAREVEEGLEEESQKWGLPLAIVVVGMFMSVLDVSIVNVAIPAMQKAYNVNAEDIAWVATAYTLVLGVIVPTSAWLGERLGLRRLYVWSLVAFAIASGLCGIAGDLGPMIGFRILQAIPGGIIPVLCLGILTRLVPPSQMGKAMGLYGFGMVVAPGVGPALGGYLVEYVDWRLIFMINVPIGLLGAVAAMMVLPELPGKKGKEFDTWGFITVASGLFAVLLAVSKGADWGWDSYPVLILLVASALLLGLFVVIELQVSQPLLNVRVFARFTFLVSILMVGGLSTGLFAALYFVPVFLQGSQDITPMNTGLAILPQAAAMMILMPVSGALYDRFGARWPAIVGTFVAGVGTLLMSGLEATTTRSEVVVWTLVQAGGLALAFMPVMSAGLAALPGSMADAGNSYHNLVQRVAGALGLSAFTALSLVWKEQAISDQTALIQQDGVAQDPRIQEMMAGPGGLVPMWQQILVESQAASYAHTFMVMGWMVLLAAPLGFLLPSGRPDPDSKPQVELG